MKINRRICRLADSDYKDIDLRDYEAEILAAIEKIAPGTRPVVEKDSFTTDDLTQSQAVRLGRELYQIDGLKKYGKIVTQARLFTGRRVEVDEDKPKQKSKQLKGGHR